jgi:hypothetical protein
MTWAPRTTRRQSLSRIEGGSAGQTIDDVVGWSQLPVRSVLVQAKIFPRPRRLHEEIGGAQEDIQPDRCLDHVAHEGGIGDPIDPGRDLMRLDVNL